MPLKRQSFYTSSIIAGSGEGISTPGVKHTECYIHVIGATAMNPALMLISAQRHEWYSMAALLSAFALALVLLQLCTKNWKTGQSIHIQLVAVVLAINCLTYGVGYPIFDAVNQSAVSFAEIQVLLSGLFGVFSRRACVSHENTEAIAERNTT